MRHSVSSGHIRGGIRTVDEGHIIILPKETASVSTVFGVMGDEDVEVGLELHQTIMSMLWGYGYPSKRDK